MPVEVPDQQAAEVLRLLVLGIRESVRRNGGSISAECQRLLAELHAAGTSGFRPGNGVSGHTGEARAMVTAHEAAGRLGVSADHIRRLCRTGRLRAHRSGGTWLVELNQEDTPDD